MRTLSLSSAFLAILSAIAAPGCSTIIAPDTSRLRPGATEDGGVDGGSVEPRDGGPSIDEDGGPLEDRDGGPIVDRDGGPLPLVDGGPIGPDGGSCTEAPSCIGDTLRRCVDGAVAVETCALGCAPDATVRCGDMAPSNVSPTHWLAEARDVTITGAARFDTSTCMSAMTSSRIVDQPGGPSLCVLEAHNLTITASGLLGIVGSRPLVVMATGDVEIDGLLDVSADLDQPAGGGGLGGRPDAPMGIGPSPGRPGAHVGTYDDGGGSGGGFCGAGGAGGTGGSATGGIGGTRVPAASLIPLRGGSGGGMGPGGVPAGGGVFPGNFGRGGAGGGAVQISALGRIRVRGQILAGGGGGRPGGNDDAFTNYGAGGGGGSGGGILLEAPTVEVDGRALGATGGGGAGSASRAAPGQPGENGSATMVRAAGGAAGGTQYGARGGDSGGGAMIDASAGANNTVAGGNGGGGGGGSGCIVVRTATGTLSGGMMTGWSPSADGVSIARVLTR